MGPATLESPSEAPEPPLPPDILRLTAFPALIKSWLVRYYDHLIPLVFLSLVWFLTAGGGTYLLLRRQAGWHNASWPWLALALLGDLTVSFFCARACFLLLNEGSWSWDSFRKDVLRSWGKACGLALIWAGGAGLGVFNLAFYLHWNPWGRVVEWVFCGILVWFLVFWACLFFYLWPLLFFQDPPFFKTFTKAGLLVLANLPLLLALALLAAGTAVLFFLAPVAWAILGFPFFFSFQCMLLEKHLLRYKITFQDRDYGDFLVFLETENQRGWRYFLKPWEHS